MKKGKFKISRLFAATILVIVSVFVGDAITRMIIDKPLVDCVEDQGDFVTEGGKNKPMDPIADPTEASKVDAPGYTSTPVTKEDINRGLLVPVGNDGSFVQNPKTEMVDLSDHKNMYYTVLGEGFPLSLDAANAFNDMMEDYANATAWADFAVFGTDSTAVYEGSPCPKLYPDCITGNTVDVALIAYDSVIAYDGRDVEKWVNDNCMNYGYIVRYPEGKNAFTGEDYCPWHLRYVGYPHSLIMGSNNMCLEEYIKYIQQYTEDSPLECTVNDITYEVYSVASMGDVTYISTPINGGYDISGDGSIGYIVTRLKQS